MHYQRQSSEIILQEYKKMLMSLGIKASRMIVYGSHSCGVARHDSDIDVVVVSDDFNVMNLRQRLEILGVAAARIRKPIEAQGYTPQEILAAGPASFLREIVSIGKTI